MEQILRRSPVIFKEKPVKTEMQDGFRVALEYAGEEGEGPRLIDLSHRPRWDVQDRNIGDKTPLGVAIPDKPGASDFENGFLVNRMNATQAAVISLTADKAEAQDDPAMTDTLDATVFLALAGDNVFRIAEKLSAMDFTDNTKTAPFLIQGPFSHVPAQLTVLQRDGANGVLLLTCSRGYAHDMVEAILHAGAEFGVKPAGYAFFAAKLS